MRESTSWFDPFLMHRQPMEPIDTNVTPRLKSLPLVRAVIFDVYGTLVISGSGDVGSADDSDEGGPVADAMSELGPIPIPSEQIPAATELHEEIRALNDARRNESCPKPEVDIVEAWRRILARHGAVLPANATQYVVQLAAAYEARANPTWPMPAAGELLRRLKSIGIPMGIVSNAQVFTPSLVEDLLDEKDFFAGGFDLNLCIFSNRFRQAKPGPRLFEVLCAGLARRNILPHEAIYVGNDMLNDVWAARNAGLKTAWFAGDARSCRPRTDEPRCRSIQPDVVLTNVLQLLNCLRH